MAFSLSPYVPFVAPQMPSFPGVPTLIEAAVGTAVSVATGGAPLPGGAFQQTWGIFTTGGTPILQADSVFSVEFMQDFRISDYPVEQGAFASFNKVQIPYMSKITFALNQSRESFLQGIFAQLYSLDLVTIVTPEISYPSANLVHCGYRRTAKDGVTLILVEIWCEEVRVVTATQPNTASQNGEDPQNDGPVQPVQTTSTPVNPTTGQPTPTLPNPPSQVPSDGLPSPNISNVFYNTTGIPPVPNDAANLNYIQQAAVAAYGGSLGVTTATVQSSPPPAGGGTPTGNMYFSAPANFSGPGSE